MLASSEPPFQVIDIAGWEVVRLRSDLLQVDVLPGKGGDILSVRTHPAAAEVMFQTRWGLRAKGAVPMAGDPVTALYEAYPGGWQTVFPNGGDPVVEHGVLWGMHGEAWFAPWEWADVSGPDGPAVSMTTRLVRSPFALTKVVALKGDTVRVTETVQHLGAYPVEVMWSHHPAFGADLLDGPVTLETAARTFVAFDPQPQAGDLSGGSTSDWPLVSGRTGRVDLREIPGAESPAARFGALTDFTTGLARITNAARGLTVELTWDHTVMPHAWLWLESLSSNGFPWFGTARVLAIEPATTYPGRGLQVVRETTGLQVELAPGERRTTWTALRVAGS